MFTEQHRQKLSESLKKAWQTKRNKAVIGEQKIIKGKLREKHRASDGSLYWKVVKPDPMLKDPKTMSRSYRKWLRSKGYPIPKFSPGAKKGSQQTLEHRNKRSISMQKYLFDLYAVAREERNKIRKSLIYRLWRDSVFKRDNYTCQKCNARNGNGFEVYLEAHHIKSYTKYPKLRFKLSNGVTLCRPCHKQISAQQMIGNENGRPKALIGITAINTQL